VGCNLTQFEEAEENTDHGNHSIISYVLGGYLKNTSQIHTLYTFKNNNSNLSKYISHIMFFLKARLHG
jgi:hypothetical protein